MIYLSNRYGSVDVDWGKIPYIELKEKYGFNFMFGEHLYGVGYSSEPIDVGWKRKNKQYQLWSHILRSCFGEIKDAEVKCTVCEEWLDFANFHKWYDENYFEIEGGVKFKKNLIVEDNLHHCPELCVFAPNEIIGLLRTNFNLYKGRNQDQHLPHGIRYNDSLSRYSVSAKLQGKYRVLAYSDDPYELIPILIRAKEYEIKTVADKYKDKISRKLYEKMIHYKYEVNVQYE